MIAPKDKAVGLTNRERFWSAIVACNIAGALIAKDLGIIDFDIKRVFDWIVGELKTMRTEIKAPAQSQSSVIGEFMNSHRAAVLVINGEADKRSGMEQLPILEPKFNDLFVRIEPDNKHIYINAKQFRKYCSEIQITLNDVLGALKADKAYLGQTKKRLGKGTKIVSSPVDVYLFDMENPHFQDATQFIEETKSTPVDVDSRTGLPS